MLFCMHTLASTDSFICAVHNSGSRGEERKSGDDDHLRNELCSAAAGQGKSLEKPTKWEYSS